MNLVVLKGRLARDPEVRITGTGKAVVYFTVACDAGKDQMGIRDSYEAFILLL